MSTATNKAELIPGRRVDKNEYGIAIYAERSYQVMRLFGASEFGHADISGLPSLFSAHPIYPNLIAAKYRDDEDNALRWVVTVVYEPMKDGDPGEATSRIIRRSYLPSDGMRDLSYDQDTGEIVQNTAGDPYSATVQVPVTDLQIVIQREEDTDPATVMALNGTVNSDSVQIGAIDIAAYEGRLTIQCEETDGASDFDYVYTYTVQTRKNNVLIGVNLTDIGWREAFVERGFRYLDGSDPAELVAAMVEDEQGNLQPVNEPVLLANDGTLLPPGGTVVITIYDAHPLAAWTTLALGIDDPEEEE
jgi:hypothetical protein